MFGRLELESEELPASTINREIIGGSGFVELAQSALDRLEVKQTLKEEAVIVHDGFIGPGYGIPTAEGAEAIRIVARSEGLFLDPTYTAKALAGYLAYCRAGYFRPDETIIFLHTGGEPALFVGAGRWLFE